LVSCCWAATTTTPSLLDFQRVRNAIHLEIRVRDIFDISTRVGIRFDEYTGIRVTQSNRVVRNVLNSSCASAPERTDVTSGSADASDTLGAESVGRALDSDTLIAILDAQIMRVVVVPGNIVPISLTDSISHNLLIVDYIVVSNDSHMEHRRVVKCNTRDITVIAGIEAEQTRTTWVSAQITSRTILSTIPKYGTTSRKVYITAMREPEHVSTKSGVERNINIPVDLEREVRSSTRELNVRLEGVVATWDLQDGIGGVGSFVRDNTIIVCREDSRADISAIVSLSSITQNTASRSSLRNGGKGEGCKNSF